MEGKDEGYTLIEVLVALMILGLALTGLGEAVRLVGRIEQRSGKLAKSEQERRALSNGLAGLFQNAGPISSAGGAPFQGSASQMIFACGQARCEAQLNAGSTPTLQLSSSAGAARPRAFALAAKGAARFEYLGSRTSGDHWPPDNPSDWQRLRAVQIIAPSGAGQAPAPDVLASVKIWTEGSNGPVGAPL